MISIKPHAYAELPQEFYTLQNWQGFDNPLLVIENSQLKKELGLENIKKQELLDIFNGSSSIENLKPLSMAYSGHQFGQYVEQLGDGRGLLLGEIDSIYQAVIKLIYDKNLRSLLSNKTKEISNKFSWKKCSEKTFDYLVEIHSNFNNKIKDY